MFQHLCNESMATHHHKFCFYASDRAKDDSGFCHLSCIFCKFLNSNLTSVPVQLTIIKQATCGGEKVSTIIYRTDPKTQNVFAYRSTSYRDPVTKRPRTKQEYLGRVDPETHEILPKGVGGKRNRSSSTKRLNEAGARLTVLEKELADSRKEIEYLKAKSAVNEDFFSSIKEAIRRQEEKIEQLKAESAASE